MYWKLTGVEKKTERTVDFRVKKWTGIREGKGLQCINELEWGNKIKVVKFVYGK